MNSKKIVKQMIQVNRDPLFLALTGKKITESKIVSSDSWSSEGGFEVLLYNPTFLSPRKPFLNSNNKLWAQKPKGTSVGRQTDQP